MNEIILSKDDELEVQRLTKKLVQESPIPVQRLFERDNPGRSFRAWLEEEARRKVIRRKEALTNERK